MNPAALRFAPARVNIERRADYSLVLRSPEALGPYARAVGDWLEHWAIAAPERVFLAEREVGHDGWRRVDYRTALDQVRRIGQALLERGLGPARPLAILSENGVEHALLTLGAMHAGVPAVPISPAYSLLSRDHAKLAYVFALVGPGAVWADDPAKFASALAAIRSTGTQRVDFASLVASPPGRSVEQAFAAVGPDTVAKILFTSGSTGEPKGVVTTQRMLCANQQMLAQGWPFVEDRPPVVVDWLPWSHTFGGNHNFNLALRNGGTLYVDGGKPLPVAIETTARNLAEISPTIYFNVPRGFDLLLPFLERDAALRRCFFHDLDALFYAAAALPQNLWRRLEALALGERGAPPAMLSAWGSTETSPLATQVHFPIDRAGVVGLPVAGCELKLVPAAGKLEARVRGPHVTPGYHRRDDLTRAAFDEEGFYRIGDALAFADAAAPERGLAFDGRLAENFKLSTGTWVHPGALRTRLIAAADPLIQDAVITGHDRDEVGALVFLHPLLAAELPAEELRQRLSQALRTLAESAGEASSIHPSRLLVLGEPPSIDAGEITDKGYLNQRAVIERRAERVAELYAGGPAIILASDASSSR